MKRWICAASVLFCVGQVVANNMPLAFSQRPPAQSMLQADVEPEPELSPAPKSSQDQQEAPVAAKKTDVASLVTVDGDEPATQAKEPVKAVASTVSPSVKARPSQSTHQLSRPRWESIQPQGDERDDTFVVTDPEPALLAGQVSELEQQQSLLQDSLNEQKQAQSDQVSQLSVQVVQMKKVLLMLNQMMKGLIQGREAEAKAKANLPLLERSWLGLTVSAWFVLVLELLVVLLLIGICLWRGQVKGGSLDRHGVFLCIAEAYIAAGDMESAKRILKRILTQGTPDHKAKAAALLSKLF